MHDIEPYSNWRHIYTAEEDERSPFFQKVYNEFEYTEVVYNYYIHPQWDYFGSPTLYIKLLMVDYELEYAVIEMMGEWNDAIGNDIKMFKDEILDFLYDQGIKKFILIAENVLNFHSSDDAYYEYLNEQLYDDGGWWLLLNLPETAQHDFLKTKIDRYLEQYQLPNWRIYKPIHLYRLLSDYQQNRLEN
jgi:hypothetical protein